MRGSASVGTGEKRALYNGWQELSSEGRRSRGFSTEESDRGWPRAERARRATAGSGATRIVIPGPSVYRPMRGAPAPAVASELLPVTLADVRRAADVIRGTIRATPLIEAPAFPGLPATGLYLKLENLQRTGAFKLRGATNRISQLTPDEAKRGVIAASAGNHSQGVAWAARARGIPATVVMALSASPTKVRSTRELGARV